MEILLSQKAINVSLSTTLKVAQKYKPVTTFLRQFIK
jgi:hypothetical protein